VFKLLGKHPECKGLDARGGFISRCTVAEHARKVGNLLNPATVVFAFDFDSEAEAHGRTVAPSASQCPTRLEDAGGR